MAAANPIFKAAVPFYGGNIMTPWGAADKAPFELTSGINCPMLFHFGATDGNPSPDDQAKLDAELTRLGKPHQFYSYPGAGHAFMDFTNPERYHEAAAQAAWPRTLDFFATHLKGASVTA
jgi:carboxymethylenebutenolidase